MATKLWITCAAAALLLANVSTGRAQDDNERNDANQRSEPSDRNTSNDRSEPSDRNASNDGNASNDRSERSDRNDRAVLHFADMNGSIRDWEAEGDEAILIEGANGQWYRAQFFAPCVGLRFETAVAFVTDPLGNLDEFSSILVDGERCWFRTFERTNDPDEGRPQQDVEQVD